MNVLILNTAAKRPEIALTTPGETFYRRLKLKTETSETLLPVVDAMLCRAGLKLKEINCLAGVIGPGSFTGIRVGLATVRALSFVTGIPCVGVTYFDVLSYNIKAACVSVIDGNNGVCYVRYKGLDKVMYTADALKLAKEGERVVCDEDSADIFGVDFTAGQRELTGAVSERLGEAASYEKILPYYLRRSQAERTPGEL